MNWGDVLLGLAPEHLLLAGIVLLILIETLSDKPRGASTLSLVVVAAAALAAAGLGFSGVSVAPFVGQVSIDPATSLAKAVVLALALPVLLLAREEFDDSGPFYPLLLSSLYGLALMISSRQPPSPSSSASS